MNYTVSAAVLVFALSFSQAANAGSSAKSLQCGPEDSEYTQQSLQTFREHFNGGRAARYNDERTESFEVIQNTNPSTSDEYPLGVITKFSDGIVCFTPSVPRLERLTIPTS